MRETALVTSRGRVDVSQRAFDLNDSTEPEPQPSTCATDAVGSSATNFRSASSELATDITLIVVTYQALFLFSKS